jgi:hypothetical protein
LREAHSRLGVVTEKGNLQVRGRPPRARGGRPVTAIALAKYEADQNAIASGGLPDKMPDVLYHYTTWQGFRGIVSSQCFHARAHHCTNDLAELTSVDDILTEIAKDLARVVAVPLRPPLIAFLRDLPKRKIAREATVYIACFSLAKDKPSQWQAYADGGKGVCLGLRVLHNEKPPAGSRAASLPVFYDMDAWRTVVRERFGQVLACHSRFGHRYHKGYSAGEAGAWSALMQIAAVASMQAKKPEWFREEEWRTVVLRGKYDHDLTAKFKQDGSEYIELRLREPPLLFAFDEILLGPRQELGGADAIAEARRVLERAGYPKEEMPPITISTADLSE